MWFWHPSKEEIENWVEAKEKEFTEQENKKPRLSAKDWLHRYFFYDIHEIFFASFPIELSPVNHGWPNMYYSDGHEKFTKQLPRLPPSPIVFPKYGEDELHDDESLFSLDKTLYTTLFSNSQWLAEPFPFYLEIPQRCLNTSQWIDPNLCKSP